MCCSELRLSKISSGDKQKGWRNNQQITRDMFVKCIAVIFFFLKISKRNAGAAVPQKQCTKSAPRRPESGASVLSVLGSMTEKFGKRGVNAYCFPRESQSSCHIVSNEISRG